MRCCCIYITVIIVSKQICIDHDIIVITMIISNTCGRVIAFVAIISHIIITISLIIMIVESVSNVIVLLLLLLLMSVLLLFTVILL